MTDCSVIHGAIMKRRRRSEQPEVRKRQILDAARSTLIRRGYQDVRLDDISRSAGISKGALYLYFHDKEDLFAAVLGDLVERLEARLQGVPPQGSALDMLRMTAQEELAFVDENKDFIVQFSLEKPSLCGARAGKELQRRFAKHLLFLSERIEGLHKTGKPEVPRSFPGRVFPDIAGAHVHASKTHGAVRQAARFMRAGPDGSLSEWSGKKRGQGP
jgi:AcrR family transcriptional regulator